MRLVLPFALTLLLAACASQPGETGGFSSHYFKNPPPDRTVIEPAQERVAAARPAGKAKAVEERQQWDFSSHYFKNPRPQDTAEPAPKKTAEAPKPAVERAPVPAPVAQPAPQHAAPPAPQQTAPPAPQQAAQPAPQEEASADTPMPQTGFFSHYFKPPLTRDELAVKLEARVLMLVTQERRRIDPNAKPLVIDLELSEVARRHSEDMASKNYVGHASDDGQTTATMLMDEDAKFRGVLGENIASQNYDSETSVDLDDFAQRLVDSWLNSEDHKANLAYAPYERTGVGVAVNGHTIYVTQLFASDLGLPEPDLDPPPAEVKSKKPAPKDQQKTKRHPVSSN